VTAIGPTPRLLYHLVVSQGPGVRGRVFLNDLPVYEDPPRDIFETTTLQVNNFLIPGKNELRIEVTEPGSIESRMFWADIHRDADETQKPVRTHELRWPDAVAELPAPLPQPLPFVWQREVTIEADHPAPYYADVPAEQVPAEGTDELRAAVKELHDALTARDANKLAELTWFEAEDSARYYPARPAPSRGELVAGYAGSFQEPWNVPRWDAERLVFTPRAGGRVIHVTGADGKHAVHGANAVRPEAHFLLNPLLVRHRGRWQLYR